MESLTGVETPKHLWWWTKTRNSWNYYLTGECFAEVESQPTCCRPQPAATSPKHLQRGNPALTCLLEACTRLRHSYIYKQKECHTPQDRRGDLFDCSEQQLLIGSLTNQDFIPEVSVHDPWPQESQWVLYNYDKVMDIRPFCLLDGSFGRRKSHCGYCSLKTAIRKRKRHKSADIYWRIRLLPVKRPKSTCLDTFYLLCPMLGLSYHRYQSNIFV